MQHLLLLVPLLFLETKLLKQNSIKICRQVISMSFWIVCILWYLLILLLFCWVYFGYSCEWINFKTWESKIPLEQQNSHTRSLKFHYLYWEKIQGYSVALINFSDSWNFVKLNLLIEKLFFSCALICFPAWSMNK